ncbi:FolC bifunctional protein [Tothia fuscella]|uniref:FolC bifunctional protein n=1 Tax=Tothia fuscella TaxID=1048955 RepID=A0A9P4NTI8_9PEZI|nr:FolC bifunctional protein [Tothia fuscella]
MIQLGLRRTAQLFRHNPQPWKAVHVAGTNGKGTICTYLSALLHSAGIPCGRFTSPHLIDRWDCITINEKPVSKSLFNEVEAQVLSRNKSENIGATEFELLTATAFDIFTRSNIQVGVVEVGMGGLDDATNVLKSKDVTIIAKIGLDHQAFLGDTVEEIAKYKCGIFREGVPVIYNSTNDASVIDIIKEEASRAKTGKLYAPISIPHFGTTPWRSFSKKIKWRKQQKLGIACAFQAFELLYPIPKQGRGKQRTIARDTIINTILPGRAQMINLRDMEDVGIDKDIMVDGAHNMQATEYLGKVVRDELRSNQFGPVVWVVACTKGKDIKGLLRPLLMVGDSVAAVEFGTVDGMPWINSTPCEDSATAAEELAVPNLKTKTFGRDIKAALKWAVEQSRVTPDEEMPVVATGSLYLVSEILRLLPKEQQIPSPVKKKPVKRKRKSVYKSEYGDNITVRHVRSRNASQSSGTVSSEDDGPIL